MYHLNELKLLGYEYDYLYCLYPTAPLRNANDLLEISKIFDTREDALAVIAATDYSHYPFQALACDSYSKVSPFWPELVRMRSSQLPDLVAGNGSTYAISVQSFFHYRDFYTPVGMYVHRMEKYRSIDVDNLEDFALLQACVNVIDTNRG